MRLAPDFDLLGLFGSGDADAPGFDAPGIARYPGSRRELSMEMAGADGVEQLLMYSGRGPVQDRKRHFRNVVAAADLRVEHEFGVAGAEVMAFAGDGRRYLLYLSPPRADGVAMDILQIRLSKANR